MSSIPKCRAIIWNDELEVAFQDIKRVVSAENLLNFPNWGIIFTVHTYSSDKQLGTVIIKNDKPISLLPRKLSEPHNNYTTTEKEILLRVECIKQLRIILFGYRINLYLDHKNLVYAVTQSEY